MNEEQLKVLRKYARQAKRNQARSDRIKNGSNNLSEHGGWSVGYGEGYNIGVTNLIDELLALEGSSITDLDSAKVVKGDNSTSGSTLSLPYSCIREVKILRKIGEYP